MTEPIFLKYFTQADSTRVKSGFETIDGDLKNEAERLRNILISGKIICGNQKGYFRYKEVMPCSVSFTGARLESLDNFFTNRSKFGFAVLRTRLPKAKPVIYLDEQSIKDGDYNPKDKWLIDLVRTSEDCYMKEIRPYDFSWQEEWRIRASTITFKRLDFVFAPGEPNCKKVRELYGQETYDTNDHITRVNAYRNSHEGRNPPLEEFLGRKFIEKNEEIKKANPKEGRIILPEVVELAWDEIKRLE